MKCDHCSRQFEDRANLVEHVLETHQDALTAHERDEMKRERKQLRRKSTGTSLPINPATAVKALAIVAVLGGGGFALLQSGILSVSTGGGSSTGAVTLGAATHEHMQFDVIVNGEEIDFSQQKYQMQSSAVHFEERRRNEPIHKHRMGVTIAYTLDTLGLSIEDGCLELRNGGQYCESQGNLTVTAGGREVDPHTYELRNGVPVEVRYTSEK